MSAKMCPREPTPEMSAAAMECASKPASAVDGWNSHGIWRAMYDAAPPQADAEALLRRVLETMEAEARAILTAKNATDNFSSPERELDAMTNAMVDASEAVKAARAYFAAKDAP